VNFFVDGSQIKNNNIYIDGNDINHIKNVLRYKENDLITVVSKEDSSKYLARIVDFLENEIKCEIIKREAAVDSRLKIDIFQALPKADKMELIIQKCSEIGVNKIIPVAMKRCVVRLDEKDAAKKIQRWQKISEVAAKQCQRTDIMKLDELVKIDDICRQIDRYDLVLIAYEKEENSYLKEEIENIKKIKKDEINVAFIVGPEGGFDLEEIEKLVKSGAKAVSLGKRILRTETAPIVVSTILMYEMGDIGGCDGRN